MACDAVATDDACRRFDVAGFDSCDGTKRRFDSDFGDEDPLANGSHV